MFGLTAKELFSYNRENFQFDKEQGLERELMRLEMQVKRFELFREDIRDLVELCVGRMEMYHLVGAMFLEFCVALYCEGKLHPTAPPWILALFYLSVASSYLYLVLAVWFSMHASICAHSFGVRLLTRYVRLPIPSETQMSKMNAKLADFEQQDANKMMRVPFVGANQNWPGQGQNGLPPIAEAQQIRSPEAADTAQDLLGKGEAALGDEKTLMHKTSKLPGKHVALFRRLQRKWQCFDAYARVSMSIGCNWILQTISYYLINVTLLQYHSKTCCIALITAFQAAALALAYVDVAKLGAFKVLCLQALAIVPCFLAAFAIMYALHQESNTDLDPDRTYPAAPVCFFLVACWLEYLLYIARPSRDEAALPRKFRAVLFLDVFDEAINDPTRAEQDGDFERMRASRVRRRQGSEDADGTGAASGPESGTDAEEDSEGVSFAAASGAAGSARRLRRASSYRDTADEPFTLDRLPWTIFSGATRCVQLAWLLMVVMQTIDVTWSEYRFDGQILVEESEESEREHSEEGHEQRRLRAVNDWHFEYVPAIWPRKGLARPEVLSCVPTEGHGGFLLSTPFEQYQAMLPYSMAVKPPISLAVLSRHKFPPGAAAFCMSSKSALNDPELACISGKIEGSDIRLWRYGQQLHDAGGVVIRVDGRPWLSVSGAIVPCSTITNLIMEHEFPSLQSEDERCLLLAGWDGKELPVAAVSLRGGTGGLPQHGQVVVPSFDAPLQIPSGAAGKAREQDDELQKRDVMALHVEPRRRRLWALLAGGVIQAWDLAPPRSIGQWKPCWEASGFDGGFEAAALCEGPDGMLLAGRSARGGPAILAASTEAPDPQVNVL